MEKQSFQKGGGASTVLGCPCHHHSRFHCFEDYKSQIIGPGCSHMFTYSLLPNYHSDLEPCNRSPQELTPCVLCFSSLTGHKGELNMSMHANLSVPFAASWMCLFKGYRGNGVFLLSTDWISPSRWAFLLLADGEGVWKRRGHAIMRREA